MFIIFFIFLVVIILASLVVYNSLIGKKNQVSNAFASIDVLLKKRYDLIPNLVATVKTYMTYEAKVLTDLTQLRAKAISGNISEQEKNDINNKISKALGTIMVAVENYPNLKANEGFLKLQASLNEIEEQISAARRAYNASVTDYNNALEMFPTNVVGVIFNFRKQDLFIAQQDEKKNPDVKDLFDK